MPECMKHKVLSDDAISFASKYSEQLGKDDVFLNYIMDDQADNQSQLSRTKKRKGEIVHKEIEISSLGSKDSSQEINSTGRDEIISVTSTDRDISMVLNHSILTEEDFLVLVKRRPDMSKYEDVFATKHEFLDK